MTYLHFPKSHLAVNSPTDEDHTPVIPITSPNPHLLAQGFGRTPGYKTQHNTMYYSCFELICATSFSIIILVKIELYCKKEIINFKHFAQIQFYFNIYFIFMTTFKHILHSLPKIQYFQMFQNFKKSPTLLQVFVHELLNKIIVLK